MIFRKQSFNKHLYNMRYLIDIIRFIFNICFCFLDRKNMLINFVLILLINGKHFYSSLSFKYYVNAFTMRLKP